MTGVIYTLYNNVVREGCCQAHLFAEQNSYRCLTLRVSQLLRIHCLVARDLQWASVKVTHLRIQRVLDFLGKTGGFENLCLGSLDEPYPTLGVIFEVCIFIWCFIGLAKVCDGFLVPSLETVSFRVGPMPNA